MSWKSNARRSAAMLTGLGGLALALANPLEAQDFEWRGALDEGDVVEIRGVNGGIRAMAADGNRVVVTAVKKEGRDGSADDVTVEVVEHAGGVTICAMYPDRRGKEPNRCAAGNSRISNHRNDTRVDFEVRVPRGVELRAGTVNGDVKVDRIDGDVRASTVNGDVEVASGGNAEASTVNGSIRATMEQDLQQDLEFSTVNGSLTIELPDQANADIDASTVNGGLESDFPLTISGRFSNRSMKGRIGDGGHRLELNTVNGGIRIRRS